jgi:small subunit ribosomal protein S25e
LEVEWILGGGSKKKSIAAAERAQSRAGPKEGEAKEEKKPEQKAGPKSVVVTDDIMKTIRKEAPKTGAITPYTIASKYNLKISTAKGILKELEMGNIVRRATSNRRIIVYTPIPSKTEAKVEQPSPAPAS